MAWEGRARARLKPGPALEAPPPKKHRQLSIDSADFIYVQSPHRGVALTGPTLRRGGLPWGGGHLQALAQELHALVQDCLPAVAPPSPLYACLSASTGGGALRSAGELRAVFDEIDANKDGQLSTEELQAYARRNGLPTAYVAEFLANAQKEALFAPLLALLPPKPTPRDPLVPPCTITPSGERICPPQAAPRGARGWLRLPRGGKSTVDFAAFKHFVELKEKALRQSFARIDENGDGEITLEELQAGISHVRVSCGGGGAFQRYRPVKQACAVEMMRSMNKSKGETITLQDFLRYFTLLPSEDYLLDYWLSVSCCGAIDVGSNVQVLSQLAQKGGGQDQGSPWNHLLAGGLAGAVSRTATAPLETLRLQMMINAGSNMTRTAADILRKAGWRAFFRGNLTNVVRSAPQKAIDFFAFEAYKQLLGKQTQGGDSAGLAAGALAGATSTVILYPLDVVRSRLTVGAHQYRGILDALTQIARQEGLGALYRGIGPSVVSIIPEAAICYGAFDMLKKAYKRVTKKSEIGVVPALTCGVVSAFTGQLVSYPLELVTRRLQVQGAAMAGGGAGGVAVARAQYSSMGDALVTILREEGVAGLYRGIVPASIKIIPMASISFGVYELSKYLLVQASEEAEMRKLKEAELEAERNQRPTLVTAGEIRVPSPTTVLSTASPPRQSLP